VNRRALIALLVWVALAATFAAASPMHRGEGGPEHHCEFCHLGQNSVAGPKVPPVHVYLADAGRHRKAEPARLYREPFFLAGVTRGPPSFLFAL
jgi:hypothetical protein